MEHNALRIKIFEFIKCLKNSRLNFLDFYLITLSLSLSLSNNTLKLLFTLTCTWVLQLYAENGDNSCAMLLKTISPHCKTQHVKLTHLF